MVEWQTRGLEEAMRKRAGSSPVSRTMKKNLLTQASINSIIYMMKERRSRK